MEANSFQEKFIQVIIPVFEGTIEERKKYYLENPKPEKEHVENIINSCSNANGAISGISGMLPGIAGLVAIVPELKSTVENQITMIYDIGVAYGKEEHLSKEMVLSLAMQSGIGSAGINALTRQGEKVLIKKASVKVFQQLAKALGVKLSASVIKSAVAKFVPVLGGIAIGIWVKYTTTEIGENSAVVLSKDFQIQETDKVDEFEQNEDEKLDVLENKVIVLMNLMKADGESKDKEKEFITQIIDNIDFSFYTSAKLKVDLQLSSQSDVDFKVLADSLKSDKDSLLIDMISLAKRDGELHAKEFEYIMQVCEKLNLDRKFVINELGANYLAIKYYLKDLAIETSDVLVVSFNSSKNNAQFYKNNRIFIIDTSNKILKKGIYLNGGKKIVLDNGVTFESTIIIENLIKTVL
jgi:uncharacterized tellurite resistance protein B-like protein